MRVIKDILAEHYASTCAIVDEFYHVRYTYGEIDHYLRLVAGRDGKHNILDMAREGLDVELTIALHQAFEHDKIVVRQGVWLKTNGKERMINLIVRPINDAALQGRRKLIIFELGQTDQKLQGEDNTTKDAEEGATISRLRKEVIQTQKALQNVTQALQAKSEELTSSLEEIRSANEEIQTTNEELRTSKEELESMNEELNTLNTQLTDQNHALFHANNTLHNFLQSADVGIIFLDQDLAIREYTSAVTTIFALRTGDKGRPLIEIVNQLDYADLITDAQHVLDTLDTNQHEVRTKDGKWFTLRIYPYRTTNNAIDGLVLTFSDITIQKQAQTAVEKRSEYMKLVFDVIEHSLIELDTDLQVVGANQTFYETFQIDEASVVGSHLYTLGNGQWDIPELRHLLTEIIPAQMTIKDYKLTHDFPELGLRTLSLNARQIAELDRILLMITVVSTEDQ